MDPLVISDRDPEMLAGKLLEDFCSFVSPGDMVAIPTGRSPGVLYRQVREDPQILSLWSQLRFLQLDEYLDPPPGVALFREELREAVFDPIGVPPGNRLSIDPSSDPIAEARRLNQMYEEQGPMKVAVLGLGSNGHIAFNEPSGEFGRGYRVVELAKETIVANCPAPHPETVEALTIGIDQITSAQHIQLLVPQAQKQEVLERALRGPIDPQLPASALGEHPSLHIYRMVAP